MIRRQWDFNAHNETFPNDDGHWQWGHRGMGRLRRERPKAFDPRIHFDQVLWALLPWLVSGRMPRATTDPQGVAAGASEV